MQAVIRTYSGHGAKELLDALERNVAEVTDIIRSVQGFVSYTLARTESGGFSVTICQDKAGIDESVQKARDWVAKNAGNTGVGAPQVVEGAVIIQLK
jgi:hypothetical protein